MKILCIFGQHNYGDPTRGEGYEYTNFLPTFSRLGHDIYFFESHNRTLYFDFVALNKALLQTVEIIRPDIVFTVMMLYEIWLETWSILRDSGIAATVKWTTDDSWKYRQSSRLIGNVFHAITTTYEDAYWKYLQDGISRVLLTQWAANAAVMQKPLPARECRYAVTFIGSAHGNRREMIKAVRDRGIEVNCFGHGWPNGPINADEIPRILRHSMISLNFADAAKTWEGFRFKHVNQIKARTFEVPGAGGFLLTQWAKGLDRFYKPGKEIAVFHDLDELVAKIRYYVSHEAERDAIAQAGYLRTLTEHTYDARMAEIVNFALKQREKYFLSSGLLPTNRIDWNRFKVAALQHRLTRIDCLIKKTLIKACSIIWGPDRGPRAARRLVYEISWRIMGSTTFTAKGLPGRMFYKEG
jgi:spore maturation protein CgeB